MLPTKPKPHLLLLLLIPLFFSLSLIITHIAFFSTYTPIITPNKREKCDPNIVPFYIVPLPSPFNSDLLLHCTNLSPYTNMCPHIANLGLGQPLSPSLHSTHQFIAELIFLARAQTHPCRTLHPSSAQLFLLPFLAGLYASSQLSQPNLTLRDSLALRFASSLPSLPTWSPRSGHDHFLVIGRTSWDFMRQSPPPNDFGSNTLLLLPQTQNISILSVELIPSHPQNHFAIPYPSYFHPSDSAQLKSWQKTVLNSPRTHLFAFIGAPRPPNLLKAAPRARILRQCANSPTRCIYDPLACHNPLQILNIMRKAEFCLQPPGDSFTRRSVFDSVLAGCIPVFFSKYTAYSQYVWYVPHRPDEWSVFLGSDRWDRIEEELDRIPKDLVLRMRERLVEMIPRVTYAHPNASSSELGFRDAVDVALVQLSKFVRTAGRG